MCLAPWFWDVSSFACNGFVLKSWNNVKNRSPLWQHAMERSSGRYHQKVSEEKSTPFCFLFSACFFPKSFALSILCANSMEQSAVSDCTLKRPSGGQHPFQWRNNFRNIHHHLREEKKKLNLEFGRKKKIPNFRWEKKKSKFKFVEKKKVNMKHHCFDNKSASLAKRRILRENEAYKYSLHKTSARASFRGGVWNTFALLAPSVLSVRSHCVVESFNKLDRVVQNSQRSWHTLWLADIVWANREIICGFFQSNEKSNMLIRRPRDLKVIPETQNSAQKQKGMQK